MTYQGAVVSPTFLQRWRSGNHVGSAIPTIKVEFRRGEFRRRYHNGSEWPGGSGAGLFGLVVGSNQFWYPDWFPLSAWQDIGEVMDMKIDQSFDKNGVATTTLVIDNTILEAHTGVAGLYHLMQNGWWTPLRGYQAPGQPAPPQPINANFQQLPNAQVRIWVGYGADTMTCVFTGLIDSLDVEGGTGGGGGGGQGAQVTINARDFGGMLLDAYVYNWNADKIIKDPLTFVPRNLADKTSLVGGGAIASSTARGHPARLVTDSNTGSAWEGDDTTDPANTQWVEIAVPDGQYNGVYIFPEFAHQYLYVSIYARPRHTGKGYAPCRFEADDNQLHVQTIDHDHLQDPRPTRDPTSRLTYWAGWVDLWSGGHQVPAGPGGHGNIPWCNTAPNADGSKGITLHFGGTYFLGVDSRIRISVRNLHRVQTRPSRYRAGIGRVAAQKLALVPAAKAAHWVVVSDVSEIVETVLRWAGFKSWEIETTGVDLKTPYVTGKAKSYMDVINDVKKQTGFVFFIAEPQDPNNDQDLGTPIFRSNRILSTQQQAFTEKITDDKLLLGSRINYTNQDERIIIRVRGAMLSRKQGGQYLNGDPNSRAMYVYTPPWASRMAGVIKHFTHYDPLYLSITDCQFAAYLIAMQICLSDVTGTITTPLTPHIGLDSYFTMRDRASGTTSRLYVANRNLQFTAGEQAKFLATFGGAIMDTPDLNEIITTYRTAAQHADRNDGPAKTHPPTRRVEHAHKTKSASS